MEAIKTYICIAAHLDLTVNKSYVSNKDGEIRDDVGHKRIVKDLLLLKKLKLKK